MAKYAILETPKKFQIVDGIIIPKMTLNDEFIVELLQSYGLVDGDFFEIAYLYDKKEMFFIHYYYPTVINGVSYLTYLYNFDPKTNFGTEITMDLWIWSEFNDSAVDIAMSIGFYQL